MTTKREWVLQAFKNESVDKVPVGFWYHLQLMRNEVMVLIQKFLIKILLVTKIYR